MTMTTLVTGGTGYVGGALVRALRQRGERVRVLARKTSRTEDLVGLGVEIVTGDILDQASVEQALDGCDTLYHVAPIYEFWTPDKALLKRTTVEGTRNVLAAAQAKSIRRVIYTSTSFTIGEPRGQVGTEETPHRGYFVHAYEEAKYHAEQVARDFARQGLPVVILNPAGIFGPGPLKSVGDLMLRVVTGRQPMLFRGRVSYVYIDDVVQGHLLAPEKGRPGERYIVSAYNVDTADFLRETCRLAGVKPPPVGPLFVGRVVANLQELAARLTGRPPDLPRDVVSMLAHGTWVDGSKAERELGLRYTPLEEAIARTLAYYWQQGWLKNKPAFLQEGVAARPEIYAGGKQR